ncbi:hypothetical protein T484DRAFT_1955365 [Baffinella frigidus]|nr:hypothetical protein T484DRAFT_1955365 [Cryptophyta sp. CCMP2293]
MSLADETALLWEEVETDGPSLAGAAAPAAWAVEGPVGTQPKEPSAKNISSGRGSGRKPKRVFSSSERIKRATLRESSEVLLDIADRVPFGCVRSHSEHVWVDFMSKTRAASKATRGLISQALWFEKQLLPSCTSQEWPQHAEKWRGECRLCNCENLCKSLVAQLETLAVDWNAISQAWTTERVAMAARQPQHRWTSAGKIALPLGFGPSSARVTFVMLDFSAPASRPDEEEEEVEEGEEEGLEEAAGSPHGNVDPAARMEDGGGGGGRSDAPDGDADMEEEDGDADFDQLQHGHLDEGMGMGMLPGGHSIFDDGGAPPAALGSPDRPVRLMHSSMHACSDEAFGASALSHERARPTDHFSYY